MADDHEHVYELKIGVTEIVPQWDVKSFHIYAECECGEELSTEEIEEIINAKR